jgi:glycosyltransferase involved in cell wall biosynthesis
MLLENKENNIDTDFTDSCRQIALIIPAYQPNHNLLCIVDDLLAESYPKIIVINDGSSADKQHVFQQLSRKERVVVLHHKVNKGKGQALKTAFSYVLNELPQAIGVVTLDADGQHLPGDVKMLSETLRSNPESLCLGVREFQGQIPLRSRFGNVVTKHVFSFFTGTVITDTQTGLRGIPRQCLQRLLDIQAKGYDFELEMLVRFCKQKIPFHQVKIKTIYEEYNPSSHFRPLIDSLKIYFVFLRFTSASLLASSIDMLVFSISMYFSNYVFLSIIIGRLVSGTLNFFMVKMSVFRSRGNICTEAIKYVLLAIVLMLASYGLITSLILGFQINPYLSKILGETLLFLISFTVQRIFIFPQATKKD